MEKLTIARIGVEKVINYTNKKTGKPDSFKKVGVLTNEYGDRWFDVTYRGDCPIKMGQSYEFEIKEREYTTKDGEVRTAYNAELPREAKGGPSEADKGRMTVLENKITTQALRTDKVIRILMEKGLIETPKQKVPGTNLEYPDVPEGEPFENLDEIRPEDIPFD